MHSPTPPNWIKELASQERERREDHDIARAALGEFQELLGEQVAFDIEAYSREFPGERANIQWETNQGISLITRTRDEGSEYTGLPCQVQCRIAVGKMVVECSFPQRPALDKQFKIVLNADGTLGLAESSVADLSQYMLTPVRFDKLIPSDPPDSSEAA
jgi:hypothetical protein